MDISLDISFKAVASVSLILFSVIDIIGSIPIIIDLREKEGKIESLKATVVAGVIMILFLIVGTQILNLFGIDVSSFAIAGAIILFLLGLEMILGITFFKSEPDEGGSGSIVPLAFPLIAGAGSMTTIISLKSEYSNWSILLGIIINLIFVYIVLKSSGWIQTKLGKGGANILRKVFGIILLAIAIKLFKTNI
ncbi:MarC family protein [Flammeovirga sp. MY04]|uniref:MarC family protein n=1 Tax=Flammeovirga sp. MY04 TaxID=1191459 RepID=UPI0008062870|nr:MarC family protein [Flammeovirga sp. MY04]ANQ50743.1 MarC family protein [Flammeovirga sp. MY04]